MSTSEAKDSSVLIIPVCVVNCRQQYAMEDMSQLVLPQWLKKFFIIEYQINERNSLNKLTLKLNIYNDNPCSKSHLFLEFLLQKHDPKYKSFYSVLVQKLSGYSSLYNNGIIFDNYRSPKFKLHETPEITVENFLEIILKCSRDMMMSNRQLSNNAFVDRINYLSCSEDINAFIKNREKFPVVDALLSCRIEHKDDPNLRHLYSMYYPTAAVHHVDRLYLSGGVIYGDRGSNKLKSLLSFHNPFKEKTLVIVDNVFRHDILHSLYPYVNNAALILDHADIKHVDFQEKSLFVINERVFRRSKKLKQVLSATLWTRCIFRTRKVKQDIPSTKTIWYIYDHFTIENCSEVFDGFHLNDIWSFPCKNSCRLNFVAPIMRYITFYAKSTKRLMVPRLLYSWQKEDTLFYKSILSRTWDSSIYNKRILRILCKQSCGIQESNVESFEPYEYLSDLKELSDKFPMYNEMELVETLEWCDEKTLDELRSSECFVCTEEDRKDMIVNKVCKHPICLNCARITKITSNKCCLCKQSLSTEYYRLYDNKTNAQETHLHINAEYVKHVERVCSEINGKTILFTHYPELLQQYQDILERTIECKVLVIPKSIENRKLSNYEQSVLNSQVVITTTNNCRLFSQSQLFHKVIALDCQINNCQIETIANGFHNSEKYFICKNNSFVSCLLLNRRCFVKTFIPATGAFYQDQQASNIYIGKKDTMKLIEMYRQHILGLNLQYEEPTL